MKKTPLILLADDNPDEELFIRDAFSYVKANLELKIFDGGQELLQHLQAINDGNLPSLIVLDYNMPKLNGADILKMLLKVERYNQIPKIMLTTSYYQPHIESCMKMGASGYLIKPDNVFSWQQIALEMLEYLDYGWN